MKFPRRTIVTESDIFTACNRINVTDLSYSVIKENDLEKNSTKFCLSAVKMSKVDE